MAQLKDLIVNGSSTFIGLVNTSSPITVSSTPATSSNDTTMATTAFVKNVIDSKRG